MFNNGEKKQYSFPTHSSEIGHLRTMAPRAETLAYPSSVSKVNTV